MSVPFVLHLEPHALQRIGFSGGPLRHNGVPEESKLFLIFCCAFYRVFFKKILFLAATTGDFCLFGFDQASGCLGKEVKRWSRARNHRKLTRDSAVIAGAMFAHVLRRLEEQIRERKSRKSFSQKTSGRQET